MILRDSRIVTRLAMAVWISKFLGPVILAGIPMIVTPRRLQETTRRFPWIVPSASPVSRAHGLLGRQPGHSGLSIPMIVQETTRRFLADSPLVLISGVPSASPVSRAGCLATDGIYLPSVSACAFRTPESSRFFFKSSNSFLRLAIRPKATIPNVIPIIPNASIRVLLWI